MDEKQLILEQYRIYNDMKERFIDRSFMINRFYLILSAIFIFSLAYIKIIFPAWYSIFLGLEIFGIAVCIMWVSNQDSYTTIIKIKYNTVIEKLEEFLPQSPNKSEYKELIEQRANKKIILVKDIQKWFAVILMLVFVANFLIDITNTIFVCCFNK